MELRLPEELRDTARFAWAANGRNGYRLGLGHGEYLTCSRNLLDRWEVVLRSADPEADGGKIVTDPRLAAAIAKAENFVRNGRPRALELVDLRASWRRLPASEKQLEWLRRAHLNPPPRISRGQASHLIAMLPR
jgi:hypothetical protein